MQFILRRCFVFLIIFWTVSLYSQSIVRELHHQDINQITTGHLLKFRNGDLLYTDFNNKQIQISRLESELKSIRWTKTITSNQVKCDFPTDSINPESNIIFWPFFIDSKDQIWCSAFSYNYPNPHIYHYILLDENAELLWYRGYAESKFMFPFSSGLSTEDQAGLLYYFESYHADLRRLNKIHMADNGTLKILSAFEYPYNLHDNFYSKYKSNPSGNLTLSNIAIQNLGGFHIFDLEKSEIVLYRWGNTFGPNIKRNGNIEWFNDEEFLITQMYRLFNAPSIFYDYILFAARVNINGDIKWSKISDAKNSFNFDAHENHWHHAIDLLSGNDIIYPLHRSDGGGTGYLTIDAENGNLKESNFWANRNLLRIDWFQNIRNENLIYYIDQNFLTFDTLQSEYKYLVYDKLDDQKSCLRIPVCEFEWSDIEISLNIQRVPFTPVEIDTIIESGCSITVEIIPAAMDWREICPEIDQYPDAFFTLSSDTICQRELVPVVVQYNHQYFEYNWHLNGTKIEPVSASNDTFYFDFDLEGEAELHLTTSRLGCESEYAVSFFLVPGAQIEGPSDTIKCKDIPIFLPLPVKDGYIIQWENGINPLRIDTAGIYTYTSIIPETGCKFSKSIQVTEKNAPKVNVDTFYSFCTEDITRSILPKAVGNVDKMEWIFPEQGSSLLLFPSKSDTYLLRVENATCVDTISVDIRVQPCTDICPIFIPNAFSPNDDGINDYFEIFPGCSNQILSFRMEIFDRWGNMVFHSNEFNRQWDGNIEGKIAPAGGYTYKLKMTLESENEFEELFKEGFVGLVR